MRRREGRSSTYSPTPSQTRRWHTQNEEIRGPGARGTIFAGYPYPVTGLVRGDLVGDRPEERRWCAGPATFPWGLATTVPRGFGCTSSAARWCGSTGTECRERSRWTRPSSAGLETGGRCRHLGRKALVAIAAVVRGRAIGRIRMHRMEDASADSLLPFVQHAVQSGSVVKETPQQHVVGAWAKRIPNHVVAGRSSGERRHAQDHVP